MSSIAYKQRKSNDSVMCGGAFPSGVSLILVLYQIRLTSFLEHSANMQSWRPNSQ